MWRSIVAFVLACLCLPGQSPGPFDATPAAVAQASTGSASVSGKAPAWATSYQSPYTDSSQPSPNSTSYSMAVATAGGRVFVTGASTGSEASEMDMVTVGYDDATGSRLWEDRFLDRNRGHDVTGTAVAVSASGHRVYATGISPVRKGVWVTVAYRAGTGHRLWVRHFSGPNGSADQLPSVIRVSPDGARIFVGGAIDRSGGGTQFAVVAYRANTGRRVWTAKYHGRSPSRNDSVASLVIDPDGRYIYAAGPSRGHGQTANHEFGAKWPNIDYVAFALSARTGKRVWVKRYDDPNNGGDFPYALQVSPDGNHVFVTGSTNNSLPTPSRATTIGYRARDGHRLWISKYRRHKTSSVAAALTVSPDGKRVFVGGEVYAYDPYSVCQTNVSDCDYLTVAYAASTGRQVWVRRHGTSERNTESISGLAASPDGRTLFVSGTSGHPEEGVADYLTIAYNGTTGRLRWLARYNSSSDGGDSDVETATALRSNGGGLYLTGVFTSCDSTVPGVAESCVSSYGTVAYRLSRREL